MIWKNISWKDAQILVEYNKYIFVDLREEEDYNRGHFAGAINIPYYKLFSNDKNIKRDEIIRAFRNKIPVFYCERGGNSMLAARKCAALGINAYSVIGGFKAY